jgi:replicative DNA helicase
MNIHIAPQTDSRPLPHNIEAEQALIGAIMVNPKAFERISEIIRPDHFFEPLHSQIFDTASRIILSGRKADPIALKSFFENDPPLTESLTIPQYLVRLNAAGIGAMNAHEYATIVRDLALRRQLITIGEEMIATAYVNDDLDIPPRELISEAESRLFALAEQQSGAAEVAFHAALDTAIKAANDAYQRKGALAGIATGFADLDERMGGLQASDLIVLAGRPSMGKTALATNIAFNVARAGHAVYFSSQEMSESQLAMRILAEQSEVSSDRLRRGRFSEDEFKTVLSVAGRIRDFPLTIDPTGGISLGLLAQRARRAKRRHGIDLVIVDYLQLMTATSRKNQNRVQEITEITTGLKALAKELAVPVIALSQLSRKVEERSDKRPQLADLRESGSIEQDADVVMFVYRDDYYLAREEPDNKDVEAYAKWAQRKREANGTAEVILAKQRHGPIGVVKMAFNDALTRFDDLSKTETSHAA